MTMGAFLARSIADSRAWTLKLMADVEQEEWGFQPVPGLAHPLWICGHLACSEHVLIHERCLDRSVLDKEFAAHFPIGGPVASVVEHDYPDPDTVKHVMADLHARTLEAVKQMSDVFLEAPAYGAGGAPHPHYVDKKGAIIHCCRHEGFHAGQLAMLRRLMGKPFLR